MSASPKNPLQTSGLYTRTTLEERDRMPDRLADGDLDVHALVAERADGDDNRAHVDAIRARRDALDLEGERRDLVRCDDLLALHRRPRWQGPVHGHLRVKLRVAGDERQARLRPGAPRPRRASGVAETEGDGRLRTDRDLRGRGLADPGAVEIGEFREWRRLGRGRCGLSTRRAVAAAQTE